MEISTLCDINQICIELEKALMIDGSDYAERDIDKVISNVKTRIIRQYQLDLTNIKIYDEALYVGKQRAAAVMFVENMAMLHARLCSYLCYAMYAHDRKISPANINYVGFTDTSFIGLLRRCVRKKELPLVGSGIQAVGVHLGMVSNCIEKKLVLIFVVAYELGLYEIVAVIAEILLLGVDRNKLKEARNEAENNR